MPRSNKRKPFAKAPKLDPNNGSFRPRPFPSSQSSTEVSAYAVALPQSTTLVSHATVTPSCSIITLTEEARQTSLHDHSSWGEQTNLREKPLLFISAGQTQPLANDVTLGQSSVASAINDGERENCALQDKSRPALSSYALASDAPPCSLSSSSLEGDTQSHSARAGDRTEVLLGLKSIRGKHGNVCAETKVTESGRSLSPDSLSSDEVLLFHGRNTLKSKGIILRQASSTFLSSTTPRADDTLANRKIGLCTSSTRLNVAPKTRRKAKRQWLPEEAVDEDVLADYIDNLRNNGEFEPVTTSKGRDACDPASNDTVSLGSCMLDRDSQILHATKAFDRSCTGSVSRRDSPPRKILGSQRDGHCVSEDEATLVKLVKAQKLDSRSVTGVDDHLSDDLAICGTPCTARAEFHDRSDPGLVERSPRHRRRKGSHHGARIKAFDEFESDMELQLDMAWKADRPKKTQKVFDELDSDLELQLRNAWKTDKLKKKERRIRREELRAAGMLRKKARRDDLRTTYPAGMTVEEVAQELSAFLQNEDEVISFPPMDVHARKIIHELANRFNVKSKSTGKADQRRPILYRTGRTLPYVEASFKRAVSRIHRRFMPRLDNKGKRHTKTKDHQGGSVSAISYQEGELVGSAAPELGVGNKGRAMLEKMGWSCGTALGAGNNGILQPVTHAMKRSKAGLG